MYKAVVFDMDGVILDSEKIYRANHFRAAEHFGLPTSKVDEFCNMIAGSTRKLNSIRFDKMFGEDMKTPITYDEYRAVVDVGVEAYAEDPGYDLKPGVRELMDFLRDHGIRTALATSTSRDKATRAIERQGLTEYFDGMVFGDMIERCKPDPDIYLTACREIGVAPKDAIGVEDSINGVISSHRAGLYTVMVIDLIQPNDVARENADIIYTRIDEIIHLFDGCEEL